MSALATTNTLHSRSPSSIHGCTDLSVDTPSLCLQSLPFRHGSEYRAYRIPIPIHGGAHFMANVPYQGTIITPDNHQTWGTAPHIQLDDPSSSA
ncbi:hypothetical protein ACLOJK_020085 [Asimina triloba]